MELMALFLAATIEFKLPAGLLESLCYVESTHKITAIHHDDGGEDSLGVCQVQHTTAKYLGFKGTTKQLMDPKTNIHYAAKYLAKQIKRYNSVSRGIIAYNRGNARNLITSKYLDKVIKTWVNRSRNVR